MASEPSAAAYKSPKKHDIQNALAQDCGHKPGSLSTLEKPAFPLVSFLWPARGGTSQWIVLPLVLMIVGLFRWTAGFWGYSGFQSPPMHGDFEAQRHWMEITIALPISQWYFHDLEWWGLDYPPLTAYHSWIIGKIGSLMNPAWFALNTSRGLDDPSLKIYMRATVFISEYLIYVPAVVLFVRRFSRMQRVNSREASIALVAILMQPATILIDHAHFQYNTVMLGFVAATMASINANNLLWACVFFVASLGFKQMALYYAPTIFAYLLGTCLFPRLRFGRLISIALVTVTSFVLLFLPLLVGAVYDSYQGVSIPSSVPPLLQGLPLNEKALYYAPLIQLIQSIHRIFPFARGLFEDKVANFWCAVHTFHKLHRYPTIWLQRVSLGATASAILPPCLTLFTRPQRRLLPLALAATAWGFFLFSFQVHEKSVLLPLLPMTLMLSGEDGLLPQTRAWVTWANVLGAWTLFPLLKRDELRIPYFILTLLWAWLMGVPEMLISVDSSRHSGATESLTRFIHGCFYLAMITWHVVEAFVPVPDGKPNLWVVINVLIGAAGFSVCYLWCLWSLARLVFKDGRRGKAKIRSGANGKPKRL